MDFSISVDASPPNAFVIARGELDLFTSHQLSRRLHEAVDAGCRRVYLDLTEVSFVDASALRVLDRVRTQFAEVDGQLRIVGWSPRFHRMCRMTGLEATFGLVEPQPLMGTSRPPQAAPRARPSHQIGNNGVRELGDVHPRARPLGTPGAAGLLVATEGEVLLQLRARWAHQGGTWSIPGGARERGESMVDAALREAREELPASTRTPSRPTARTSRSAAAGSTRRSSRARTGPTS